LKAHSSSLTIFGAIANASTTNFATADAIAVVAIAK
tara:strand:- start:1067 stop:1174 length:108 start_codon:yes stop_codon:yes gene_type:complete